MGNLAVKEGDSIKLKCSYQEGFPLSNGTLFFSNGATTYVEKVEKSLSECCRRVCFDIYLQILLQLQLKRKDFK